MDVIGCNRYSLQMIMSMIAITYLENIIMLY